MRRILKSWVVGFGAGVALLGGALAGVSLGPVPDLPGTERPAATGIDARERLPLMHPVADGSRITVMTYNVQHGQPCAGGGAGHEVASRMEFAVYGGPGGEPGLAALAPDIIGMQEVSQVLVDQSLDDNLTCRVFKTFGLLDPRATEVTAYEHAGDYLVRRLNGATTALGSPYKMRFVRDNPRVLPLVPDVAAPPDDETLSDRSTRDGNIEIGLGLISRFRIQQVTVHNLTVGEVPGETRALMHATVRVAGEHGSETPIDFYDSHLTTTGGDSPQTVAMAAEIVRFIRTTRRHPGAPGVFVCDCNAEEGSAAYELFAAAGFIDTYRVANPKPAPEDLTSGRDGLSHDCAEFPDGEGERIDYVWGIPDGDGGTPAVVSSRVVMDFSAPVGDGCLWPSDHNAVVSTLELGGPHILD